MIVLAVSDADGLVDGKAKFPERGLKAAALVDAGGQNHHRFPVEGDLELEAEVANGFEPGALGRAAGRDNRTALNERLDAARRELADENGRHGTAQHPRFAARR